MSGSCLTPQWSSPPPASARSSSSPRRRRRSATRSRNAAASSLPPGPAPARRWLGWGIPISRCRPGREASHSGRRGSSAASLTAPATGPARSRRLSELLTIGVDAEVGEPLPPGLIGDIALPEERRWIERLSASDPAVCWDRLLFSVKESIYKAWFPLARSWLGFEDASVAIDPSRGTFSASLLVPGPTLGGRKLDGFSGRWLATDGLLLSATALSAH